MYKLNWYGLMMAEGYILKYSRESNAQGNITEKFAMIK